MAKLWQGEANFVSARHIFIIFRPMEGSRFVLFARFFPTYFWLRFENGGPVSELWQSDSVEQANKVNGDALRADSIFRERRLTPPLHAHGRCGDVKTYTRVHMHTSLFLALATKRKKIEESENRCKKRKGICRGRKRSIVACAAQNKRETKGDGA